MTREEMLAGLRDLLRRLYEDSGYSGSDELVVEAAITALEAAPAQVEAPPSESARERAQRWLLMNWPGNGAASDAVHDRLAAEFDQHTASLRAELEQARGERDAYKKAKAENDERFMIERDEARRERDAALARVDAAEQSMRDLQAVLKEQAEALGKERGKVAAMTKVVEAARGVGHGGSMSGDACRICRALAELDKEQGR